MPLAVTMGDPAGIGLEITRTAWLARNSENLTPFVVYADPDAIAALNPLSGGRPLPMAELANPADAVAAFSEALPVIPVPLAVPATPGRPDPANAPATIRSIDLATADVLSGRASALVTNPIAKSVLTRSGFRHPGHTEYLAHLAAVATGVAVRPVMMLAAADLRTVPVTIHVPLADVPRLVTADLIVETVLITARDLTRRFGIRKPRIAVAGLNPHAGEDGTIGLEDADVIAPAIASLRTSGLDVTGPHPADTLFHAAARLRYDAAVCMYHDQALIPVKTLAFDTGVNVTLGLPFVRTSPDHGTAFDIAGSGRASHASLIAALSLARHMTEAGAGATAPLAHVAHLP